MENTKSIHSIKNGLKGIITVPGDKSISHRAIMFGALAEGETEITNFLNAEDCLCTAKAFQNMGIEITGLNSSQVQVKGRGLIGLTKPNQDLDLGNSGTSIRLLSGMLAPQPFTSTLIGDQYLCKRPMSRIIKPLTQMGASISGKDNMYPPLVINGKKLRGIDYISPVASAQVKSCILLAGLYAEGETSITEPSLSRDHTERMLQQFGGKIETDGLKVTVRFGQKLKGCKIHIPGDISSAAFFLVAAAIVPNSNLIVRNVGINPTRTGILDVFKSMGIPYRYIQSNHENFEPTADIQIEYSKSNSIICQGDLVPRIIDEIPILAVLATQAEGTTIFRDARELRVKETDRIRAIVMELRKMGANLEEREDGFLVHGPTPLRGACVQSYGDHRMAMSLAIAGLIAYGKTTIEDIKCVDTSFPGFFDLLDSLQKV